MAPSVKEACKPSGFKRQSKYATLVMNKDVEIGKRRNVFLGKVKQNGEVKKWKVRGEQILRTDFFSRQREWEKEQARLAAEQAAEPEDEEMDIRGTLDSPQETDLIEQFLSQQDQELKATVSMLEDQEPGGDDYEDVMSNYGSDDEEYQDFFMDVLQQIEQKAAEATPSAILQQQQNQDMDVTMG